ncbi:MAG: tetratricopeptide repeat protein, partial [Calditrichaeota bacterium]|nr:tetratricopeptide repeat protein [Calditrichota bacterium]
AKGDLQEAEKVFRQSLTLHRKVLPEGHVNLSHPLSGLGQVLLEEGDVVAAEPLLREALDLRLHALGKTHWRTAEVQATLGRCMLAQQNFSAAEQYFLQSYTTFKEHYPERTASKQKALQGIVSLYEKWGRTNEAEKYRKKR